MWSSLGSVVETLVQLALDNPIPAVIAVVFAGWVVKSAAGPASS